MEFKPYHEAIIDAINECPNEKMAFFALCIVISKTKCPKNHDNINDALFKKSQEITGIEDSRIDSCAKLAEHNLLTQKHEAEKAEKA